MLAALGIGKVLIKRTDTREVQRYEQLYHTWCLEMIQTVVKTYFFHSLQPAQAVPSHLLPTHSPILQSLREMQPEQLAPYPGGSCHSLIFT
jgi:uncharacterized membrane protein